MNVRIIGLITGKVYAQGNKTDCFRELQQKYPYKYIRGHKLISSDPVYPEPLLVVKI